MKQKDIIIIAAVVLISGIASYIISGKIFIPPTNRQQSVEVVPPISSSFPTPDNKYFNSSSFDPAPPVTLGNGSNTSSNPNGN